MALPGFTNWIVPEALTLATDGRSLTHLTPRKEALWGRASASKLREAPAPPWMEKEVS